MSHFSTDYSNVNLCKLCDVHLVEERTNEVSWQTEYCRHCFIKRCGDKDLNYNTITKLEIEAVDAADPPVLHGNEEPAPYDSE
jgi:hypothetical protein